MSQNTFDRFCGCFEGVLKDKSGVGIIVGKMKDYVVVNGV